MTPAQCQAARDLLNWTQQKLADAARVPISAVISFELSWRVKAPETMQHALEAAGIEFIDENGGGQGVRLRGEMSAIALWHVSGLN